MPGLKRSLFLAVSALAFTITIIIAGCWGLSKREASNVVVSKIEEFRRVKGRLPDSLSEGWSTGRRELPLLLQDQRRELPRVVWNYPGQVRHL